MCLRCATGWILDLTTVNVVISSTQEDYISLMSLHNIQLSGIQAVFNTVGLMPDRWWVDAKPTLDPKPGNLDHGHKPSVLGDTDVTFLLAGISPGRVGPARIDGLRQPSAQGPTQKRTKTINKQSTVLLKIRY